MARARSHPVLVTGDRRGLPYSKGLMASSVMVTGLNPKQAYEVAEHIERILVEKGTKEISKAELRELCVSLLAEIDQSYASSYLKWQAVEALDAPLVIMIGGATGTGKSTVATQLAARLGVTRVVSTDAIREVLRAAFSRDLLPALYVSSFEADEALRVALPESVDQLIVGFQEQVAAVSVGIKALIARCIEEGTDIIVEGAHVVPGFVEGWDQDFQDAVLVPVVLAVSDEDSHLANFQYRAFETRARRPRDRYLSGFDKIRAIQSHIAALASERGVPVLEISELESTLQDLAGLVVAKALEKAQARGNEESGVQAQADSHALAVKKPRFPRLKSWELAGGRKR